jgi:hypothetical protein
LLLLLSLALWRRLLVLRLASLRWRWPMNNTRHILLRRQGKPRIMRLRRFLDNLRR